MFDQAIGLAAFADAIAACDPAARVRDALAAPDLAPRLAGARRLGIAIGKAALAMARGAGPVAHGIAITPVDDGAALPAGWRIFVSAHPVPDQRSVEAAEHAWRIAEREARSEDVVLALISGGASSLIEAPRDGVTLALLRTITSELMAAGAPIADLNVVRSALSRVKAGGLVARSPAHVVTLAVSDVIGDDLAIIGSGPTIATRAPLASRASEILRRYGLTVPPLLATLDPRSPVSRADLARVILPMTAFADAAIAALASRGIAAHRHDPPFGGDVADTAAELAALTGLVVAWGEPTLTVPADHGEGGRAQQLALELARHLRGTRRVALVIGSDGSDGPPPAHRPTPAGAFIDGRTWDAIVAKGLDPAVALVRRDAGTVLAAVDALIVTGPTGINHADLAILG